MMKQMRSKLSRIIGGKVVVKKSGWTAMDKKKKTNWKKKKRKMAKASRKRNRK